MRHEEWPQRGAKGSKGFLCFFVANKPFGTMKTLYDKIWDSHVVVPETDAPAILYIDVHLIHEVTTPQAFTGLRKRGLKVRRTDKTFGTVDHSIPTASRSLSGFDEVAAHQLRTLAANCAQCGIPI